MYVVAVGRNPGIYDTWEECNKQVSGFSGARFKKVTSKEDADAFIANINVPQFKDIPKDSTAVNIFVDGSCYKNEVYGSGVYFEYGGQFYDIVDYGNDSVLKESWQIAGELRAAILGLDKAAELGIKEVNICYDYLGVRNYITGDYKSKLPFVQDYIDKVNSYDIKINFYHCEAHSGIYGNERADRNAKAGVKKFKKG